VENDSEAASRSGLNEETRCGRYARNRGVGSEKAPTKVLPLWATVTLGLCALGVASLVLLGMWRHDTLMNWRHSLEPQGERVEWPSWTPAWPPLPPSRKSTRTLPIDLTGPAAFAARNAEVMRYIPCYCGACPADHRSNLNCYVTGFRPDGTPVWTDHASTCPICVKVTREVMLMTGKRWSLQHIRETLDREYDRAGHHPSTRTPFPPQSHQNHQLGPVDTGMKETHDTAADVRATP
jgi:hypothetical protein